MCPTGPYFPGGLKPISLLAEYENVRSWPGGTGAFKLGLNYAPCFKPQKKAAGEGCDQILWLLEDGGERKVTEAGAMNFFIVVEREDKGKCLNCFSPLDVVTHHLSNRLGRHNTSSRWYNSPRRNTSIRSRAHPIQRFLPPPQIPFQQQTHPTLPHSLHLPTNHVYHPQTFRFRQTPRSILCWHSSGRCTCWSHPI